MIPAVVFCWVLLAPPLFLAVFRGKRFEETVAVTTGAEILFMYVCGVAGLLKVSVYLVLAAALALSGLSVFRVIRRKQFREALSAFCTPAFAAFALVFVLLLYAHYERILHEWDEFTHWGDVVKDMCQIDELPTSPRAHVLFQSYVPGMAVFQYLFEKIAMILPGGIFTDWRLYFAYHLLAFIFLVPFFRIRKWRYFLPALVLILFTAVAPDFLYSNGSYLSSIYIDGFVGLLAGTGFALLFVRKRTGMDTAHLMTVCALLVLAKDVGMLFAVMIAAAFVLAEALENRKNRKKLLCRAGAAALAAALPKILWEISIRANGAAERFRQPIDFGVLFRVISGQDTESAAAQIPGAVFTRLLGEPVTLHGLGRIPVTYPVLAAVMIGLLVLARALWARQAPEMKRQRTVAFWGMILTLAVYCLGMPLLYMFRVNSPSLESFDRYMSIVFSCFFVMVFLLFFCWTQENMKRTAAGIGACLLIGLLTFNQHEMKQYATRNAIENQYRSIQGQLDTFVRAMKEIAGGEEKHVWIITQELNGFEFWPIRYGIRPCNGEINVGWSIASSVKSIYPGDVWTIQIPTEEWKEKLKDYDYVMIYKADDVFIRDYGVLFRNPEDIGDRTIFAVDHGSGLMERVR